MILVAGSANLDFVVQASHIPAPGETVLGHGFKTYPVSYTHLTLPTSDLV